MPIVDINTNTTLADVLTNDSSTNDISIKSPSGEMLASITDDSADLSSSGGPDGQYGTISTNKDRTQIEFGDDNAGGYVNIILQRTTVSHDNEVRLLGLSVTKNGVEVATINDIASAVAGLLDYRGVFDASVNAYPSSGGSGTAGAILKSDFWIVSVAGILPTGLVVEAGDLVIAKVDTPGNTQANWNIIQYNIGYTPENAANKVSTITASSTLYPNNNAVIAYAQPLDSDLTAIAALSTTSFGRDFLAFTNTAFESLFKPVWSPLNIAAVLQHTGDTNETVITTTGKDMVGKLVSGDVVSFNFGIQASNNANAKTFRIYVSDSPSSLLNQTLIATATTNAGAINTIESFKYMNLTSLTTQMVISGTGTNAATGPSMGTTSIDFSTGNKYIVVTIQLAVGTDTAKLQWFRSQVNR